MSDARLILLNELGGIELGELAILNGHCDVVTRVDNQHRLSCTIQWPLADGLRLTVRTPLRWIDTDGSTLDFRVSSLTVDESTAWAAVEAVGAWLSIAKGGLIRDVVDGQPVFSFSGQGTISEILRTYVLTNLDVDGLGWIDTEPGPIASDVLHKFAFTDWNRMQLIQDIASRNGFEPYLYQSAPGAVHQLAFAVRRGSEAPAFTVSSDCNLLKYSSAIDDTLVVTAVTPRGDVVTGASERATMEQNSWEFTVLDSEWVTLRDPEGGINAIAFDGQYNTKFLRFATTTTPVLREILATRKSDQAIKLATTSSLNTAGLQGSIVDDAAGNPLTRVVNPGGVSQYGFTEETETVDGTRGERNWLPNGGFHGAAAAWNAGASGWVEAHPASDLTDVVGLVNGTVSPGSSSLVVDGFPANAVVRKGELIRIIGTDLCAAPAGAGSTIRSDGTAVVTLAVGLAYSITDNQTLLLTWTSDGIVQQQTVTVDGNQSGGAMALNLKSFGTVTRKLTNGDKVTFVLGGTYRGTSSTKVALLNDTASPVVKRVALFLAVGSFSDTTLSPTTTGLATGDSVTLADDAGAVYSATVAADWAYGEATLLLDITIEAVGSSNQGLYGTTRPLTLTAVKSFTDTVTVTNSTVEWAENGALTVTWSGGLPRSYTAGTAIWKTSGGTVLAPLVITSGAGASSTSAVLTYATRPRVLGGAVFSNGTVGSDLLFCGATTTLSGAGAGTLPLMFNNASSLPDNASVRVYRNPYGWQADTPLKNVLRAVNGATSNAFIVLLPGTQPRTAWAVVRFAVWAPVGTNFWSSKSVPNTNKMPVTFEVKDVNTAETWTESAAVDIPAAFATDERPVPAYFTKKVQFPLTAARSLTFKLTSSDASNSFILNNLFLLQGQVMITSDDAVPFTPASHANTLVLRGNRRLLVADAAAAPISGTIVDHSQLPGAQLLPQKIVLGQDVIIADVDDIQRAMQITRRASNPLLYDVDFDRDLPFFTELAVQ